jgi:hypothetical protein
MAITILANKIAVPLVGAIPTYLIAAVIALTCVVIEGYYRPPD